jgi:hypothetical protein
MAEGAVQREFTCRGGEFVLRHRQGCELRGRSGEAGVNI